MNDNCTCKECGKKYHHCTSCGYSFTYDEDKFCCEECSIKNEYGAKIRENITYLLNKLGEDGIEKFIDLIYAKGEEKNVILEILDKEFRGPTGLRAWGLW